MPSTHARAAAMAARELGARPDQSVDDRLHNDPCAVARGTHSGSARLRTGRRRFVDPTACEAGFAAAVEEFRQALEKYKRRSGRMFPTWSEILEVLQGLGYEKMTGQPVAKAPRREDGGGQAREHDPECRSRQR